MTKPPPPDLQSTVSGILLLTATVAAIFGLIVGNTNLLLFSITISIGALGMRI